MKSIEGLKPRLTTVFSDLIDVMDIAMWELDLNYRVVAFNKKARTIYGDDALGNFCYYVAAKKNDICRNCPAKKVYEGSDSGRSEHQRTDVTGKKIYIDHIATPIKNKQGELTGALVLIIDITRHKSMEEEIIKHRNQLEEKVAERTIELLESRMKYQTLYEESKRAQEVYRSLLNSSADAIVIYDMEGKAQYISPAFTALFGWTLPELKGKRIPFLPDSEKRLTIEKIRSVVDDGLPCKVYETKRYTKDGQLVDVSISASRFEDHEGRPAGTLVILHDISERKKLEAHLLQAQKMKAIGTLAGGLAHDFNNLLMGIQGRASLMLMDIEPTHSFYEHLKGIEEYVRSAGNLTKQLLGFARGGKYEIKPTDINKVLEKSSYMFSRTHKEIRIIKNYASGLWIVEVDQGQIEQVLLNLFLNAWQAMPGGGTIYIGTANIVLDSAFTEPYNVKSGRYIKLSVSDQGIGMDSATRQRIFDPFFTTKEMGRGTGLGLASVYGIIKNHEGIINVYSEKGQGTTFTIYLPVSEKELNMEIETVLEPVRGKESILLIDDENLILDVTKSMLQKIGFKVFTAKNGKDAIDFLKNTTEKIDLVILDMIMPGIGGSDTFNQIKAIAPNLRVLLSSGYSINGQASEILKRGCDGFIQKPFNLKELSEKIRSIFFSFNESKPPTALSVKNQ